MSDHEFDALFKKAAENLEVPYNPKGWKRMQKLLNQAGGGYMGTLRKGLWGLGALLLLIGSGWWISEAWLAGAQQSASIVLNAAHTINLKETVPPLPKVKELSQALSLRSEERQVADQQEIQGVERERTERAEKLEGQAEMISDHESSRVNDEAPDLREISVEISPIQMTTAMLLMERKGLSEEAWNTAERVPLKVSVDHVPMNTNEAEQAPQEVIKSKARYAANRWGLGFGLSPDLSGIGLQEIHHVSTKATIQIEFFALPNLSISSGAVFSNKIYDAAPDDYHQTYYNNYIPKYINAQCKVLDIPLNIRWYALSGEKSRFFISSGLSSYVMLSEDYEYVYENKGGSYSRDYGYENENQHLFKVANFSLGYERKLGKQWAVQLEPFVKLPLAGVGEGEIKLSTTGAFFSVYYRWGKAR